MPGQPTVPDGLPTILDTDSPDIPRDMNNLANATQVALIRKGVPIFANVGEAEAFYAIWGEENGNVRYLTDPGIYQKFIEGQWVWSYYMGVRRDDDIPLTSNTRAAVTWVAAEPQPVDTTGMTWEGAEVFVPARGMYTVQVGVVFVAPAGVPIEARVFIYMGAELVAHDHQYVPSGWDHNFSTVGFRALMKDESCRIEVEASATGSILTAAAMRIVSMGAV